MQSQNSSQVNFVLREVPNLIGVEFKISKDIYKQKCPYKPCGKTGCRKFWHKPCETLDPGFVGQLWPTVLGVGISEIFSGAVLIAIVIFTRDKYDKIYGPEAANIIRQTSIIGLLTLMLCGMMLLVALILDVHKIMWIRILTSTGLSGYVVILSVLKMHFALLAVEKDPSATTNNTAILTNAGMLEVFTLLGTVLHFFGDIAVFTYYNIRFLQPTLFYTGQVEHI